MAKVKINERGVIVYARDKSEAARKRGIIIPATAYKFEMTEVEKLATANPEKVVLRQTIGGNLYAFALKRNVLEEFCQMIGKSFTSVRKREKYNVWFIRMKSRKHKSAAWNHARKYFGD